MKLSKGITAKLLTRVMLPTAMLKVDVEAVLDDIGDDLEASLGGLIPRYRDAAYISRIIQLVIIHTCIRS